MHVQSPISAVPTTRFAGSITSVSGVFSVLLLIVLSVTLHFAGLDLLLTMTRIPAKWWFKRRSVQLVSFLCTVVGQMLFFVVTMSSSSSAAENDVMEQPPPQAVAVVPSIRSHVSSFVKSLFTGVLIRARSKSVLVPSILFVLLLGFAHAFFTFRGQLRTLLTREILVLLVTIGLVFFSALLTLIGVAVAAAMSSRRKCVVCLLAALLLLVALVGAVNSTQHVGAYGEPASRTEMAFSWRFVHFLFRQRRGAWGGQVHSYNTNALGDTTSRPWCDPRKLTWTPARVASFLNEPIWPAVLPRRLLNFYTGTEECAPRGGGGPSASSYKLPYSHYCAAESKLLVKKTCGVHGLLRRKLEPTVIVFDATLNNLGHLEDFHFGPYDRETVVPARNFLRKSNEKWTRLEKEGKVRVVERRDHGTGAFHGRAGDVSRVVQPLPSSADAGAPVAAPSERCVRDVEESGPQTHPLLYQSRKRKKVRLIEDPEEWVALDLLSEDVRVECGNGKSVDGEFEFHTHPIFEEEEEEEKQAPAAAAAAAAATSSPPPPTTGIPQAGLLVFMLDAVSKQAFARSLPRTVRWLRRKRAAAAAPQHDPESSALLVVEAEKTTVVGHSTYPNLGAAFGGHVMLTDEGKSFFPNGTANGFVSMENVSRKIATERNVFRRVKQRWGDQVETGWFADSCMNPVEAYWGQRGNSTRETVAEQDAQPSPFSLDEWNNCDGFGSQCGAVDRNYFSPMCQKEYGLNFGNFQGPYSIVKRCLGRRHVHEHFLNYLSDVLKKSLKQQNQHLSSNASSSQQPRSFFHTAYMMEGHEGSHAVLELIDADMERFLDRLDSPEFDFFKQGNSVMLMSDHGNHMGPYYEWSTPGRLERQTPFQIWVTPRRVLENMDDRDGLERGETEKWLRYRAQRPATMLETYLSFNDYFDCSFGSTDAERDEYFGSCDYVLERTPETDLDGGGPRAPCPWSRSLFKPFDEERDPVAKYEDRFARKCREFNAQNDCPLRYCNQ